MPSISRDVPRLKTVMRHIIGLTAMSGKSCGIDLQAVDVIDQLPQPSGASTIERKDQTRQLFKIRFIQFLGQSSAKLERAFQQHVAKLRMNGGDLLRYLGHGEYPFASSGKLEQLLD